MLSGLFNPPALLGVDLCPESVRLIQLGRRRHWRNTHYCVEGCAIQPIPQQTPITNRAAAISDALQQAVQQARVKTRQVVVALSASDTISKTLTLPDVPSDEMVHRVRLEAAEQIPFPIEEAALDFATLGRSAQAMDQVEILLVAARRETVEQCIAIVQAANLNCRIVDSLPLVIQRAYQAFCQPQAAPHIPYALLDTSHNRCHLVIFQGHRQLFQYSTPVTAERVLHTACEQLQTYLQNEHSLAGIWLAGPHANHIAGPLTTHLKLPTACANPFIHMTLRPGVPVLSPDDEAPNMLTACSLALRRFDTRHGSY